jgi:acyl-CoA dehydrogenase
MTDIVKPLEWEGDGHWSCGPDEGWMEEANTAFEYGYSVEFGTSGNFKVDSTFGFVQDGFDTPDEAKAAAQADYERRILSALTADPRAMVAAALERAAVYARERVVFGRPIGSNQGVSHPLAEAWAKLEAADALMMRAADLYDSGKPCGPQANAVKYLAAEASFDACETAVLTLGGMGYAQEYDVERLFRESVIGRIAPVSRQMILNFISEKVLDLPRSY